MHRILPIRVIASSFGWGYYWCTEVSTIIESCIVVVSDIMGVSVVVVVVSSAFFPQPITASARASARKATKARAESFRMFFVFTSSRTRRAGFGTPGGPVSLEVHFKRKHPLESGVESPASLREVSQLGTGSRCGTSMSGQEPREKRTGP